MGIAVSCQCGRRFEAASKLAGNDVSCPFCGSNIDVPYQILAVESPNISTRCACGSKFLAAPYLAGKRVACPECNQPVAVPGGAPVTAQTQPVAADNYWADLAPASTLPVATTPTPQATQKTPKKSSNTARNTVGTIAVAVLVVLGVVARVGRIMNRHRSSSQTTYGPSTYPYDRNAKFPLSSVTVPQLPRLEEGRLLQPSGVRMSYITFQAAPGNQGLVGGAMTLRVYVPAGAHPAQSLPCVLVAPAGTPLICGTTVDNDEYHAETLPYAEAGMVVINYSLDGPVADLETASDPEMSRAYQAFLNAQAGLVNARNALEFAIARVPQVDPNRIYVAGHSSAGTLALLYAAHDPRVKACVAYAPACDLDFRMAELVQTPDIQQVMVGVDDFIHQSSPKTHVASIKCPTLLFAARDDTNVPYTSVVEFQTQINAAGGKAEMASAAQGDHYDAMINEGIPAGIRWLQQLPR